MSNNRKRRGGGSANGSAPAQRKPPKADREWTVGTVQDEDGDLHVDRDEVREALVELEPVGHRLGHAFVVTPLRVERPEPHPLTGEKVYDVIGWRFEVHKGVPAIRPEQLAAMLGAPQLPVAPDFPDDPTPEDQAAALEQAAAEIRAQAEAPEPEEGEVVVEGQTPSEILAARA